MREALLRANRGSELERLYRDHGARLWLALLGLCGEPEVASDALAEAFAQALRRGEAIRAPARWIWRAAFRIARGELKERGRRGVVDREEAYEMEEPAVELIRALRRLSGRQRAAVVLHHLADYPGEGGRGHARHHLQRRPGPPDSRLSPTPVAPWRDRCLTSASDR
jgi:DNA-directed RNA polymerase specialized sigma24 family protein